MPAMGVTSATTESVSNGDGDWASQIGDLISSASTAAVQLARQFDNSPDMYYTNGTRAYPVSSTTNWVPILIGGAVLWFLLK